MEKISSNVFGKSDYGEDFAPSQGSSNKAAEGTKFHSIEPSNRLMFSINNH